MHNDGFGPAWAFYRIGELTGFAIKDDPLIVDV